MLRRLIDGTANGLTPALRWQRVVALAFALLFMILAVWACLIVYREQKSVDFLSYWAAAKLAIEGLAASAYDVVAHRQVELSVAPVRGLLPFPYPPPFLFFVFPFGWLHFPFAYAAWVGVTGALYAFVSRRVVPLPYGLAHPAVLGNALIGQNGFLTSGIFISGTAALASRPFLGGAILGTLVIKPQLALLLPLALLAAREWRAILGGALSSSGLLIAALLAFGAGTYEGFFKILPFYAELLDSSRWPWDELASVFAFGRHFDVPQRIALVIHGLVALVAAALTWRAWARNMEQRVPVLAASTMLIPPYLFTYDSLLLIVPLGWLICKQRNPYLIAAIWLLCLLPVASYFRLYAGPNTIPIAAILALWAVYSDQAESPQRRPAMGAP